VRLVHAGGRTTWAAATAAARTAPGSDANALYRWERRVAPRQRGNPFPRRCTEERPAAALQAALLARLPARNKTPHPLHSATDRGNGNAPTRACRRTLHACGGGHECAGRWMLRCVTARSSQARGFGGASCSCQSAIKLSCTASQARSSLPRMQRAAARSAGEVGTDKFCKVAEVCLMHSVRRRWTRPAELRAVTHDRIRMINRPRQRAS